MTGLLFVLSFTGCDRLLAELVWLLEDYEPEGKA
jgi:hypothetical protein